MKITASIVIFAFSLSPAAAAKLWTPEPYYSPAPSAQTVSKVCDLIRTSADTYKLPEPFLARLLWTQSEFHPDAADTSGGVGVARLTSSVARDFQIDDRRNIDRSIPAAAAYVARLKARFGNEGLAAAAFNVGEDNFAAWMGGDRKSMPVPTDNFVYEVTGQNAEVFLNPSYRDQEPPPLTSAAADRSCKDMPKMGIAAQNRVDHERLWSAIVAGSWRRSTVIRQWTGFADSHRAATENLQPSIQKWSTPLGRAGVYAAKVYTQDRVAAENVCDRLHRVGGACIVMRN